LTVEGTWVAIREGLVNTLGVAVVAIALALGFGALFAVGRLSRRRLQRWPAIAVIEFFRAIPLSVPRGQAEAAYAIGLSKAQVMRSVLIPQAVRIMLPAIISQSIVALKDSALGLIIAYAELARAGRQIYVFYNNPLAVGLVIAAIYVIINYSMSRLAVALEARQRRVPDPAAPGAPRSAAEAA